MLLRAVAYAPSRAEALAARKAFGNRYGDTRPNAAAVLEDDWGRMVAFPEPHSRHLRTTNIDGLEQLAELWELLGRPGQRRQVRATASRSRRQAPAPGDGRAPR
ncbi:hypothetical protein [Candidatus Palauibacter sp.]|uniref:hypothetical protein n=1 Tax=Candidatus Palauibacter sp. TaxID=3101350 RepID=UPI003AF2F11D